MLPGAIQFCNPVGPEAIRMYRGHPSPRRPVPQLTPACQRLRPNCGTRGHSRLPRPICVQRNGEFKRQDSRSSSGSSARKLLRDVRRVDSDSPPEHQQVIEQIRRFRSESLGLGHRGQSCFCCFLGHLLRRAQRSILKQLDRIGAGRLRRRATLDNLPESGQYFSEAESPAGPKQLRAPVWQVGPSGVARTSNASASQSAESEAR